MAIDKMELMLFSLIMAIQSTVISSQMCTDPMRFGDVIQNGQERQGTEFKTIENVGLVQCWKICIQYSLCSSINFMDNECTLLTGNNLAVVSKVGSFTSEKKRWPIERIAGNCYNHDCPNNSMCIETSTGFSCEIIGCVDPPADYVTYEVFGHRTVWAENVSVAIPCDNADGCTHLFTCQQNGLWSGVKSIKERRSPICLGKNSWTDWFSRDKPTYSADNENLNDILRDYSGKVCSNPTEIDARIKESDPHSLWRDIIIFSPSLGLKCINRYQLDNKQCNDYEVRFCC